MFKNFGYLLLFFFALNFTSIDAQIPNWEKKEKCKEHFKEFYDDLVKVIERCKDVEKFKNPVFYKKEIISCGSKNLSVIHSEQCQNQVLLDVQAGNLIYDCNDDNLSQEQQTECDYKKDYEKNYENSDWSDGLTTEDIIANTDYDTEKESIQLKEQERIRQQETATNNSSIERIKSSRESRGKCGYLFTDTKDEALSDQITKRKGYQSDCTPLFEKVEGIDFVRSISKSFGKFNATKWTQLAKTLSSKYKTLYKPSTAEWEDYTFNSGGYARLRYMFLNETKPEVAKYISLYVDTGFNIMYVYYFSEKHAQAHLKELGKFEKQLDDL